MIDKEKFEEPHDFEETIMSSISRKELTMDTLRVLEIRRRGNNPRNPYTVEIQRGSLVADGKIKYVKRYEQRIQNSYGVDSWCPITEASIERITDLFDGFDGGRRPENVEVEFYLGNYCMDITFSVDGRLEKSI